jgi:hypothetical protein
MMKKKLTAVMLFVLGALVMVESQLIGQTAPALTALDYEEIRQLYSRYNFGLDNLVDDGRMWAETFYTEDGVFEAVGGQQAAPIQGYEQLNALVKVLNLHWPINYVTNVLIEPTAEGAMGAAYLLVVSTQDEKPPAVTQRGVYSDQLVKTPDGWRFKKRTINWEHFPDELRHAWMQ